MKNISKTFFTALATVWLLSLGAPAQAIFIEFRPPNQAVALGDTVSADLWLVGLDWHDISGIGGYDLSVNFDSSVLSFGSVSFGTSLGLTLGSIVTPSPGAVNIADISLESLADLVALQTTSDFMLAAFQFTAGGMGTSQFTVSGVALSDANGDSIIPENIGTGTVTVTQNAVPEPSALLLVGIGVLGLVLVRRRA